MTGFGWLWLCSMLQPRTGMWTLSSASCFVIMLCDHAVHKSCQMFADSSRQQTCW